MPRLALACLALALAAACRTDGTSRPEGRQEPPLPALGFASLKEQVLYFAMVDRFADGDGRRHLGFAPEDPLAFHGGDLLGLRERLPYLENLGVTALWITPVYDQIDHPVGGEHPHWGFHGYWPERHDRIDPRFGDEEALLALLDEAHARGIRVVLDVVLNHAGYGSSWAHRNDLVRSTELGTCPSDEAATDLTRCLFGLPDFRTEEPRVRALVVGWALSLAERFPLDGFRLDTLRHVEPEAFAELHRRAEEALFREHGAQGFLALGEWWGAAPGDTVVERLVEEGAVDTVFDFAFTGLVEGFLSGRMRAEAMLHHLEARHRVEGPPLAHFLDNHDMPTLLFRLGEHAHRYPLAAVLLFTTRGMPVVAWGNELGRKGGPWPNNREDMPWAALETEAGKALLETFRALIKLRRRHPALVGPGFEPAFAATKKETGAASLAFVRGEAEEKRLLVALSRGPGAPPPVWIEAEEPLCPLFSTAAVPRVRREGGHLLVELAPDAAAVFALGACDPTPSPNGAERATVSVDE